MSTSILVIGDTQGSRVVGSALSNEGYEVWTANEPLAAMDIIRARCPALIIADLNMSALDGPEICRRVRGTSNVPVIFVSGDDDCDSEVAALDSGADDYLVKPFEPERLLARVRVALRRSPETAEPSRLAVGAFRIDFHEHRVHIHGQPVRLTPKEFVLFVFMARHPNRVLPHKMILRNVWGEASVEQCECLRVLVAQLRKKLESEPANPRYVVTEPWIGYRFNPMGSAQ